VKKANIFNRRQMNGKDLIEIERKPGKESNEMKKKTWK